MKELTFKQNRFVDEYLVDLNATQAAIRAGYKEKSARQIATENLAKPYIQNIVLQRVQQIQERVQITQDDVITQLARIAFSDMKNYVSFGPNGVEIKLQDEFDGTIIAEISDNRQGNNKYPKVKLYDKLRALELLGKHLGMFNSKDETDMNGELRVFFNIPRPGSNQ
jgi:phage terminase small subunit